MIEAEVLGLGFGPVNMGLGALEGGGVGFGARPNILDTDDLRCLSTGSVSGSLESGSRSHHEGSLANFGGRMNLLRVVLAFGRLPGLQGLQGQCHRNWIPFLSKTAWTQRGRSGGSRETNGAATESKEKRTHLYRIRHIIIVVEIESPIATPANRNLLQLRTGTAF